MTDTRTVCKSADRGSAERHISESTALALVGPQTASTVKAFAFSLVLCSSAASGATGTAHIGATIVRPVPVQTAAVVDPATTPLVTSVTTTAQGTVVSFN